ncbi:hypothetical protein WDU94_012693 [Cyamophila willieti]
MHEGKSATEIKTRLDSTLGDSAPSKSMVCKWVAKFKRGHTSCTNDPRSGRPVEVVTEAVVEKVHDLVLENRRTKVLDIAESVGISTERVWYILHEHLGMQKLCARWVPRLLTPDQKRQRKDISSTCLTLFNKNPVDFCRRFVTCDETWIHHYTPETKEQSKQWTSKDEPAPKKAKAVLSAGKVMATVFWDARGVIFVDYLEKGQTINSAYYVTLLDTLNEKLKEKRPHLGKKKVLFHQDNAPVHTSTTSMAKLHELRWELLPHPPYSPDLAPCDYHLFPNLKKWLGGKKFASNTDLIEAVNGYFEGLDQSSYAAGINRLEHRSTKCIELKGDYVEK